MDALFQAEIFRGTIDGQARYARILMRHRRPGYYFLNSEAFKEHAAHHLFSDPFFPELYNKPAHRTFETLCGLATSFAEFEYACDSTEPAPCASCEAIYEGGN